MESVAGDPQVAIPVVYMRGGTSRALVFHARDLPGDGPAAWNAIFAAALGSRAGDGRQLDGIGGGISSLSKVAIVAPSDRLDADVDFKFAQVAIDRLESSYRGNCGNIAAAIGPFAVDEGIVKVTGDRAVVRIHNTNTGKIIRAEFPLQNGKAAVDGDLAIAGIKGAGAPVRLAFLRPGGATTGKLLPTGLAAETLALGVGGSIEISLVDAANPVAMVMASALGLRGDETPAAIGSNHALMARLETIRVASCLAMGIAASEEEAMSVAANLPLIAILSPSNAKEAELRVRMMSAGQPHKATPLTGAMAVAVAAHLPGTLASSLIGVCRAGEPIRIEHASGVISVDAVVEDGEALEAVVFRTARRLMDGRVFVPSGIVAGLAGAIG